MIRRRGLASQNVKRSIAVGGCKTSVGLEDAFWRAINEIAHIRRVPVYKLITEINADREHTNLSSAISPVRSWLLSESRRGMTRSALAEVINKADRHRGIRGHGGRQAQVVIQKRKLGRSRVQKRAIRVGRHQTSVSVEDEFWQALREIGLCHQLPLSSIFDDIDRGRTHANFSSAVRLYVLDYYFRLAERVHEGGKYEKDEAEGAKGKPRSGADHSGKAPKGD